MNGGAPAAAPPRPKPLGSTGADVFLSYSTKDKERAIDTARALESADWTVWMDRWSLIGGKRYEPTIRKALRRARCVVVLWSAAASESDWVPGEGDIARERDVLVPARLDDTELPIPWRQLHAIDLRDWTSADLDAEPFDRLLQAIATTIHEPKPKPDPRRLRSHRWRQLQELGRVVAAALLCVALLTWAVTSLDLPRFLPVFGGLAFPVLAWFVGPQRHVGVLHRLRDLSVSAPAMVAFTVLLLACSNFASITVEREESDLPPMPVALSAASGTTLRAGRLTRAEPRWHRLVFAPPWGRDLRVAVDGYAPLDVRVGVFRDRLVQVPQDLEPRPVLLLRLYRNDVVSATGALVRIRHGGRVVASCTLGSDSGTVVVGAGDRMAELLASHAPAWRESLAGENLAPGAVDRIVGQWQRGQPTTWVEPPPLDARLEAEVVWPSHDVTAYRRITLAGALNDVETHPN